MVITGPRFLAFAYKRKTKAVKSTGCWEVSLHPVQTSFWSTENWKGCWHKVCNKWQAMKEAIRQLSFTLKQACLHPKCFIFKSNHHPDAIVLLLVMATVASWKGWLVQCILRFLPLSLPYQREIDAHLWGWKLLWDFDSWIKGHAMWHQHWERLNKQQNFDGHAEAVHLLPLISLFPWIAYGYTSNSHVATLQLHQWWKSNLMSNSCVYEDCKAKKGWSKIVSAVVHRLVTASLNNGVAVTNWSR